MKCEVDVQSGSLAGRHRGMTSVGVPWAPWGGGQRMGRDHRKTHMGETTGTGAGM